MRPACRRVGFLSLVLVVLVVGPASGRAAGTFVFYNVRDYGAAGDGQTKDTAAIGKAIAAATKAGGGTVYFPPGPYLTGAIRLQSNITLYLDAGAVLRFSQDFADYLPMVKSRWEGTECINFSPPIYAYRAENIAIIGRGRIDGRGKAWWDEHRRLKAEMSEKGKIETPSKWARQFAERNQGSLGQGRWEQMGNFLRPPLIQPFECRNVRIEGISIKDPPFWTINPVYCDNVTVTGIWIKNPDDSPNTDGINPDSCRNVHISNCHISVGDDCITIKSGRDEDGRRVGWPCENITVTNCTMLDGHGGVVIGSEMSGGVRKVTISNCIFDGTDRGIRIKTTRGRGGAVEDVRVSNIVMSRIPRGPFYLNMFYQKVPAEPVSQRTPVLRNIHFSNITVKDAPVAGYVLGLPEMPVENVTFSHINIDAEKGFSCKDARDISFHDIRIDTQRGPALICENVANLELEGFQTRTPHADAPVVDLRNVSGAYIHGCRAAPGTETFFRLRGEKCRDLFVQANDLRRAASAFSVQEGCPASALVRQ
ncbi:MAG: glycoside hydrolase family 28 protein [Sedimentisphaerales bacterium]|nr:glycoside hydrolase family 28 protein [Sedimentisphaerales bacterium]